jgi:hypothetical protein
MAVTTKPLRRTRIALSLDGSSVRERETATCGVVMHVSVRCGVHACVLMSAQTCVVSTIQFEGHTFNPPSPCMASAATDDAPPRDSIRRSTRESRSSTK